MKGLEPMTNKQRQEGYRDRLHNQAGQRTTIVLCPEAVKALNEIQTALDTRGFPATKKAAIEYALIWYAKRAG